ncbi:MAG: tetratricopeptide repeat protein, partial [Rhodospirillales bacterium]|nr:tetratricopeptide repeat protein [Rhodospirillales bacterium]
MRTMIAPEQLLNIVANLERSNQRPAAVAVLRNVLRDRPNDVRALVLMAELALKENHCEAALVLLGKALAVAADDEHARRLLHATALEQGPVLLDEGRNEDAAAICAQAEEAGIPDPRLVHNRGLALQRLERLDGATQAFRYALAISPNLPDTAFQLGKCLYLRGLAESAAMSLRRSLILSPGDPDSWLTLGSVLESQADFAKAETACRRAIRVGASHALAHMRLGQALARRGLLAEGFAAMEWRHRLAGAHHPPALFPQPQWDG